MNRSRQAAQEPNVAFFSSLTLDKIYPSFQCLWLHSAVRNTYSMSFFTAILYPWPFSLFSGVFHVPVSLSSEFRGTLQNGVSKFGMTAVTDLQHFDPCLAFILLNTERFPRDRWRHLKTKEMTHSWGLQGLSRAQAVLWGMGSHWCSHSLWQSLLGGLWLCYICSSRRENKH